MTSSMTSCPRDATLTSLLKGLFINVMIKQVSKYVCEPPVSVLLIFKNIYIVILTMIKVPEPIMFLQMSLSLALCESAFPTV